MRILSSIKELDYPKEKLEVVVVEEGDEPKEIPGVKYVFIPRENKGFGYSRNLAVKNASGKIIVFTDDDCIVTKDWLKELVSQFKEGIEGVTGGVLVKDCNAIGYCENILGLPNGGLMRIHNSGGEVVETKELSTCNCAYRKEVFEKLGLFREDTKYGGEDYEFAKRVVRNYKCVFYPKAIVYHKPRGSLIKIFSLGRRKGICEWFLERMRIEKRINHISYNLRASLLLKLLVIVMVLSILGLNKCVFYFPIFFIWYLIVLLKYRFQFQYGLGWKTFLLTPMVKAVIDLGIDVGRLMGGFVLWKNSR